MSAEYKKIWKCPTCRCRTPKSGNTNQPIGHNDFVTNDLEQCNITIRRKTSNTQNETLDSDQSILGDTLQANCSQNYEEQTVTVTNPNDKSLTLENINKLLETHLQQNTKSIISEIKIIIKREIEDVITEYKKEMESITDSLITQQNELREDIDILKNKIKLLSSENDQLQLETKKLNMEIEDYKYSKSTYNTKELNQKTFVLYGLTENYWETEEQTNERVINALYDILDIDLTNYIEDMSRIGNKGSKRPLKIELLSKKMVNYIIKNSRYFRNTGLAVSQYLQEQALKERNALRQALLEARRNGHHAIIRNNKLIVNGKMSAYPGEQTYTQQPTNTTITNGRKDQSTDNRPSTQPDKIPQQNDTTTTGVNNNFRDPRDIHDVVSEHEEYQFQKPLNRSSLRRKTGYQSPMHHRNLAQP